jgi:hypothetical protein
MRTLKKLLIISTLATAVGCGGDDDGDSEDDGTTDDSTDDTTDDGDDAPDAGACAVVAWTAPEFEANAAGGLALRTQLADLAGGEGIIASAELEVEIIEDVALLTTPFEEGDPSLASVTPPGYAAVIENAFADFVALAGAGPQDLINPQGEWQPGAVGGLFAPGKDVRGMNAGGLEIRQLVDKGLFGAAFYNYAIGLTEGEITPATIDDIAAAWGSNEALGTGEGELDDSAGYGFAMGFHATMAEALTAAKTYAADESCAAELEESLVTFFRTWEQSMVARTIYYANAASGILAKAADDVEKLDALHELAEGIGLTFGFRGLEDPASGPLAGAGRLLTDEDIEAMMISLGVDVADLNASTTGTFVADPAAIATGVEEFEGTAALVFDLSEADLESYRTPTEG